MKAILGVLAIVGVCGVACGAGVGVVMGGGMPPGVMAVWVEPVYETVGQRVYVPAVYETQWIELDGRMVQARVLVHEGYWTVTRRVVCVSPGHWQAVVCEPGVAAGPVGVPVAAGVGRVAVEGYAGGHEAEDRGVFSATYEWGK